MPCETAMPERPGRLLLLCCCAVLFGGCGGTAVRDGGPAAGSVARLPDDAVPREEPRSRYGNGPIYEVLGKTYQVLDSSDGYRERGVASWYGNKFHGRLTSNREVYDMHAMTAAHKTLPLPTYVRVTNLKNHKSIVVRVNDRGPFVHNRLIDLSYAAAARLDMVRDGTGLVEVTAINFDGMPSEPPRELLANASPAPAPAPGPDSDVWVQVGAFGQLDNARRRYDLIREHGVGRVVVQRDRRATPELYRVRIGPIANVDHYDSIVEKLEAIGISEAHLVSD